MAEESPGQTHQCLGGIFVRHPFWIRDRVGEAVIHGRHAGGVRVSEPVHLNRRGLPGED